MKRIAFKMKLHPGQTDEYKRRHDALWPELTALLKETGIRDYSIFLDEENHDLLGVMTLENDEILGPLSQHPIMKKWWNFMKDIMYTNSDNSPISFPLKEVFYLK